MDNDGLVGRGMDTDWVGERKQAASKASKNNKASEAKQSKSEKSKAKQRKATQTKPQAKQVAERHNR